MNDLVPDFNDPAWRTFTPLGRENAVFSRAQNGEYASIRTSHAFGLGKWICSVAVEGNRFYEFSASCKTPLAECDVYLLLTQFDARGGCPIREHCRHCERRGDSLFFFDIIDAREETVRLEIELWIKGKGAEGCFSRPHLFCCPPPPSRRVRLAPIQMKWTEHRHKCEEGQRRAYLSAVDAVGERGCDLIVLGEEMYGAGLGLSLDEIARTFTPRMCKLLSQKARKYSTYIVFNGPEAEGDRLYNTSFLIDREGAVIGQYRKTHITVLEYESGVTPGEGFPVFDLDFGRIGLLICYDQFFPETARSLVRGGAEIICIPTAGDDHHACMALAMDYGVYLAVAGMNNENGYGWGATRVVDPLGRLLAHTDENLTAAYAEIDLEKKVRRPWMSTGSGESEVRGDYRYEINPHSFV